ncbi:MAG TPA: acyltransferase [Hyphomonadaceae bacterium]|nr:acyltransferase [Hyphomonadaceae bacterium]
MVLNNIQNLRAIAAYSVVVYHCLIRFLHPGGLELSYIDMLSGGVDLFFVISGFVMVHTTKEDESGAWFMTKRVARIVPLYWCATALVLVMVYFRDWTFPGALLTPQAIASSFFFIPHFNAAGHLYPALGVGWTLNYEMMFYVLFALSMLLPARARLAGVVSLITVVFFAATFAGPSVVHEFYGNPIVFEFAAGCIIAYALRLKAVANFVRKTPMWPLAIGAVALLLLDVTFEPMSWGSAYRIGIPSVALVFAAAAQDMHRTRAPASLMTRLGDASYSAYLLHPIVIVAAVVVFDHLLGDGLANGIAVLVATLVVTAIISLYSLRFFEKPTAKFVRGLAQGLGLKPPRSDLKAPQVLTPQPNP